MHSQAAPHPLHPPPSSKQKHKMLFLGQQNQPPERPPGPTEELPSTHEHPPHSPGSNSLIKVSEEVDAERVLLVQLIAIRVLHGVHSMGGRGIFQKDVPEREGKRLAHMTPSDLLCGHLDFLHEQSRLTVLQRLQGSHAEDQRTGTQARQFPKKS